MPMIFRSTDIETLADLPAWTKGDPAFKLVAMPAPSACAGDNRTLAYAAGAAETDPIPPPYACRVVSISYVDVAFDLSHEPKYWFDKCYTECLWSADGSVARADALEHKLLSTFNSAMTVGEGGPEIHLVTWNGRTFDLPVIMMRSLKHRLSSPWYYKNRDLRYRYTPEGHCDLMDFLSDYGACRFMKLGDMARLIGLPGKTDMSGDKVAELYAKSAQNPELSDSLQQKTARYCLQDSIQAALLWLRSRHLLGKVTPETHNAALATFRTSKSITDTIDIDWEGLLL
jgi:hypothetical protein